MRLLLAEESLSFFVAHHSVPAAASSVAGGELRNLDHFRDADPSALELNLELHHQSFGALHRVRDVDDLRHQALALGDRKEATKRVTQQE